MESGAWVASWLAAGLLGGVAACGGESTGTSQEPNCVGVDTSSDAENCGSCGNACPSVPDQENTAGMAAGDGVFVRSYGNNSLMKVSRSGGPATVLASGRFAPAALAVDGESVYWTTYGDQRGGAVMKVPLAGGTPTTLYSGQSSLQGIAVDATSVYWTDYEGGAVMKMPLGGGTAATLASGQSYPSAIAIDAASVYWLNFDPTGTVMKVPLTGGSPVALASEQYNPIAIAVNAAGVCWTNYGSKDPRAVGLADGQANRVLCMPRDGGPASVLGTEQPSPCAIAVDASSVYWVNAGGQHTGSGTLMNAPLGGGSSVTLASGQSNPAAVAVDAAGVYWVNANWAHIAGAGTVMRASLDGSSPTVLHSGQDSPSAIAVDAASVYWTAYGGEAAATRPGVCQSGVCR